MGFAFGENLDSDSAKGRKRKAFESFFRQFYGKLCDFALGYVQDTDIAADIVQTVFLNLWEQQEIWDNLENAKAYLYKSVRNQALNYLKHEKVVENAEPEVRLRVEEWKEVTKNNKDLDRLKNIIRKGIDKLPSRRRKIYLLSREGGLTYKEIANVLDISVKTVETQMGRALKFLRSFVSSHWDIPFFILLMFLFQ